jgi:Fe-S oxidoreductase
VLQGLMQFMTTPNLKPNKLFWLTDDLKIAEKGKTLLFIGCLPIYQTVFENINVNSLDILRASIKLLNLAGIEPVLSNQERCSGHDMLWTGEVQTFQKLAELNYKIFNELQVETIITVCPEGYMTLKNDYPEYLNGQNGHNGQNDNNWDFEVIHITEYLADLIRKGELKIPEENPVNNLTVTYHDPCRLGRLMKVYDAPREILQAIPGLKFREMEHNRNRALCCGVSNWTNCSNTSLSIRAERLSEAQSTCSDKMITSCPKCQIHFKCYTNNKFVEPQINIDIEDITVFLAKSLGLDLNSGPGLDQSKNLDKDNSSNRK